MKKITKTRWAIMAFMLACVIAVLNMNTIKGLVLPECDLSCIEEVKG